MTRLPLILAAVLVACAAPPAADVPPVATPDLATEIGVAATAWPTPTAARLGTITVAVDLPPVPTVAAPAGLHGLPFAPEGLGDCDEMAFYRIQAGLPDRFQALGWRESNCRNEDVVRTFCCYGYWQLWVDLQLEDHRAGPVFRDYCAIYSIDDVNSDAPLDKQRQACGAKALFNIVGYTAWALS